jgi:streptogramin lyase
MWRAVLLAVVGLVLGAPGASAVTIEEFPAAGGPLGIVAGPDSNLWFTEIDGDRISRMSTSGAVVGSTQEQVFSGLGEIIVGPDGNLWYAKTDRDAVGRIAPSGTLLPDIDLPNLSEPVDLAVGSDGNVWVTLPGRSRITQITPVGGMTEFLLPGGRAAEGIAAGPDGALWFTEPEDNRVGRITTGGAITEFALPNPDSGPVAITAGPDGAIWFTEVDGNRIGRITTAGAIAEFPIPTVDSAPEGIAAGPDGNLWFTEADGNQIGRITPAGAIAEFGGLTAGSEPVGITAGPDGRMWFTELSANQIGRVTLDPPTATTGPATDIATTGATLNGTVNPNAYETSYQFEYGTTTAYGSSTSPASAGGGGAPVGVTAGIEGLQPGTTYHYRLVATSSRGTSLGGDRTFTAGVSQPPEPPPQPPQGPTGAPLLTAGPAHNLGPTGVTLTATLNPNGLATTYRAECGRGLSYGRRTPLRDAGAESTERTIAVRVRGLRPGTRYRCRLVATNVAGTTNGADRSITTPLLLRLKFADRVVSVPAGVPVAIRFRSTAGARVLARLLTRGTDRGVRSRRLCAERGVNRLPLGPLSAGSYRLRVRARSADGQRAAGSVVILAVAPAPPRYTG